MAEKKTWKEKMGYKPDGSVKINKAGIAIILALVLIPLGLGMIAVSQSNDGWMDEDSWDDADEDIYGTWQYYGQIPCDSDYQENLNEEDIITGDAFKEAFGQEVPDQTITITEDGIKEYLDLNGKGMEVTGWEKNEQTDNQWVMTTEITQFLEEDPLDEPITEECVCTLRDGYLFVECHYDSEEYDGNQYADVYTKAEE